MRGGRARAAAAVGPTVAECDAKLDRYRAALEAGADPAVGAGWIAETQAERQRAEQHEQALTTAEVPDSISRITEEEIIAIVEELGDLVTALRDAEPEHQLELYRSLGLRLTYYPETPNGAGRCGSCRTPLGFGLCPRGDLNPHALYGH